MSLLSFLTGVSSLFSGGDKTRTTGEGHESMTGEQAVVGDSTSTSTNTTKGTQNSTQNSKTKSYQRTDTWGQSNTNTATTGQSDTSRSGVQQNYSDATIAGLEDLLGTSFASGATEAGQKALTDRLAQVRADSNRTFDVSGFVSGITRAAASQTQMDMEGRINEMLSATGGSETGNSMAALLGNRVRNDAAASFAGIASDAMATGEEIRRAGMESNTMQTSQLVGDISGQLGALLEASRGGITSYRDNESTNYAEQQAQSTHYKEGQVTTGSTTGTTKTNTKTTQTSKDKTKTTETGLTQVKSEKDTKTKTKEKKGDLFTNLVNNLSKSSKDASNKTKSVAQKPKVTTTQKSAKQLKAEEDERKRKELEAQIKKRRTS
ncbi:hypothetical protein Bpfe_031106 [Biomphalaria pfeifferi]|uniref:Uncharacterized protein n=1 Tax=Biomphalaria pfeifferi TaxID=112525 RepID=A0AAD8AQ17_BIOPF|nr:hypothetical protein Bpfe_031106 [Biomphalaria pfeifferi]